jgi:hypothetical protein
MIQTAAPYARPHERRRSQRPRTLLAARLAFGDPATTAPCGVRNLTAEGAMIELESPLLLIAPVRLVLARDGVVREAKVVWRRGVRVGLSFVNEAEAGSEAGVAAVDRQVMILRSLWKEMAPR